MNFRPPNLLLQFVFILCVFSTAFSGKPNVILMMADDLANEDLSCYGSTRIKTPCLDQLAKQGVKLTNYYAGNPVCSPSRMALLSGSYPARIGWRRGVLGYGFPDKSGMSPRVHTIAEAFRDAGYRTAMTGKWHLGNVNMRPEDQGFDSVYCIYMSNNQNRDMYRNGKLVQKKWDNRLLTETFSQEVVRVIKEKSNKPFFLYVPWSAPHFPADPHPDWHGRSGENKSGKYTDVVQELDTRIGQSLSTLKGTGKEKNTIVICTSDNGRQPGQQGPNDNPSFTGHKWQSLEGGTRVPFIIRYPSKIQANKTNNSLVSAIDLYPTLASVCDVKIDLPKDAQRIDGVDVWKNLSKPDTKPARTELLYWHGMGQATAIRKGNCKLFFNYGANKHDSDPVLSDGYSFHNLKDDPREAKNLAKEHPEKVENLLRRAKILLTDIYADQLPLGTYPGVIFSAPPLKASDVWGKWIK